MNLEGPTPGDCYSYRFAADDTFSLSWYGEDLLYKVQKERRQDELAVATLKETEKARYIAEKSLRYAMIAAFGTVIGILVSLWLSR